jgi:hypothetical protein
VVLLVALGAILPGTASAQPTWWTPNAALRDQAVLPGAGPPDADFTQKLTGWTIRGPGKVDVRSGGPSGFYAALRDNSTLVSGVFTPAPATQVLTLQLRALQGHAALRVLAELTDRPEPLLLATFEPGKSWAAASVNARELAGHSVRLVLDPVIALGDGIDVTVAGRPEVPAPQFTLGGGSILRSHGGPAGTFLAAQPGPLSLAGATIKIPNDAVTAAVWVHGAAGRTPSVDLLAGNRLLGTTTAGAVWQPLRVSVAALRGRKVRLVVRSADAAGLQLTWIGTVQRAPSLRFAVARRDQKRVRLQVAASQALAYQRVRVERAVGAGWAFVTRLQLRVDGTAETRVRLASRPLLRLTFDGSESVAPGQSVPTRVQPAPVKKPKKPKKPKN